MRDIWISFTLAELTIDYFSRVGLEADDGMPLKLQFTILRWDTRDNDGSLFRVGNSVPLDFDLLYLRPIIHKLLDWKERRR